MSANWIRRPKRLKIYARDEYRCIWCTRRVALAVNSSRLATLDHVQPRSLGGSNEPTNLVTSCKRCNDTRGNKHPKHWANAQAIERARRAVARPL